MPNICSNWIGSEKMSARLLLVYEPIIGISLLFVDASGVSVTHVIFIMGAFGCLRFKSLTCNRNPVNFYLKNVNK